MHAYAIFGWVILIYWYGRSKPRRNRGWRVPKLGFLIAFLKQTAPTKSEQAAWECLRRVLTQASFTKVQPYMIRLKSPYTRITEELFTLHLHRKSRIYRASLASCKASAMVKLRGEWHLMAYGWNIIINNDWLVVWTPLKNVNQLGWLFPIYGKIKNAPNHQPDHQRRC